MISWTSWVWGLRFWERDGTPVWVANGKDHAVLEGSYDELGEDGCAVLRSGRDVARRVGRSQRARIEVVVVRSHRLVLTAQTGRQSGSASIRPVAASAPRGPTAKKSTLRSSGSQYRWKQVVSRSCEFQGSRDGSRSASHRYTSRSLSVGAAATPSG